MNSPIIARQWTTEEWDRLNLVLFDRLRSRLWLMRETLSFICSERCGESLEVCTTSLDGVRIIVDDMVKEVDEGIEILKL